VNSNQNIAGAKKSIREEFRQVGKMKQKAGVKKKELHKEGLMRENPQK